jgi:hypothetical protein
MVLKKLALDSAQCKPSLWLWYADDKPVGCPHGPELFQNFLNHLKSLMPSTQFSIEIVRECDSFSGCSGRLQREGTGH